MKAIRFRQWEKSIRQSMIVYFRYKWDKNNQLLKQMYPLKCSKFKELKDYVITDESLGKKYPVSILICLYVGV